MKNFLIKNIRTIVFVFSTVIIYAAFFRLCHKLDQNEETLRQSELNLSIITAQAEEIKKQAEQSDKTLKRVNVLDTLITLNDSVTFYLIKFKKYEVLALREEISYLRTGNNQHAITCNRYIDSFNFYRPKYEKAFLTCQHFLKRQSD